ncbi:sigma-70 RNA polymerase sigma factor region 4 domain-containing protein [Mucilaginibacter pedocola]|uniref:RNA polymerase sigma-70 region 2 domain-containing protein n=1 Tax=Mucilaginibacter pedocola TaxID=1792845 RepID=A0A1S9P8Q6_9SPHI|nr:sigma-70 family RNA polymerase sigma factor [Mucilaginibacter pedocola]OOQ57353.1 hypothetical protein BC343_14705 [Mucilaginibacter pedocola]
MKGDLQLLEHLLINANRTEAFEMLIHSYGEPIYSFFRHMGLTHDDSDELSCKLFIGFWRDIPTLKSSDSLTVLIFRMAYKLWSDLSKRDTGNDKNTLQEFERAIFYLKYSQGFTSREISCITKLSLAEVTCLAAALSIEN